MMQQEGSRTAQGAALITTKPPGVEWRMVVALRDELALAENKLLQAAQLVSTCAVMATATAVMTTILILVQVLQGGPDFHGPAMTDEIKLYRMLAVVFFWLLVVAGLILPSAVIRYAVRRGGWPTNLVSRAMARWRQRMDEGKLLTALLDPVRIELLFAEEQKYLRFAAQLAPKRNTLLSQLRFIARHANGLARGSAVPEKLNAWHFLRLWLLQGLEPLLGGALTTITVLLTPSILLYSLGGILSYGPEPPAILPLVPAVLGGLLALAQERLESRAAMAAMIETLLSSA